MMINGNYRFKESVKKILKLDISFLIIRRKTRGDLMPNKLHWRLKYAII